MIAVPAVLGILGEGSVFAASLLGALWRESVGGVVFAFLIWGICRSAPRLPASTRFWLWWMVSAKLLLGLMVGASAIPVPSPFVVRLSAQHPVAAPAFFVARLVTRPTRLLYGGGRSAASPAPKPGAKTAPAETVSSPTTGTGQVTKAATPSYSPDNAKSGLLATTADTHRPTDPWPWIARIAALVWCAGFLLRLALMAKGALSARRLLQTAVPAPESVQREARDVARLVGLRRFPRVVMHHRAASPFLAGFFRPTIVLPDPARTALSAGERRMALAHELAHLRRGDLWLALVPALAEAAFFFLPVARWAARECDLCREEVCDSAAVTGLGSALIADYGQLLLKVTLATQTSGHPAPQMGMAVRVSPAFAQLRRRLRALKQSVHSPVTPSLRRAAALLLAVCLPGMLPWHLRALPRNTVIDRETAANATAELPQYTVTDLGTLGGKFSDAYGIGENGAVVGTANVFPMGGRGHAFLWRPGGDGSTDGAMTDLCAGSVYRHSLAYGVNEKGQVAAAAFNNPLKPNAFFWTPGSTTRRYLGGLPGFRYSRATGINRAGVVVGAALGDGRDKRGATPMRAFSWRSGKMADLQTLGGAFSSATAISEAGHIVGKSDIRSENGGQGATHAVLWEPETRQPRDVGTLPGGKNSAASAVNRAGNVVGFSETADAPRRAFLYADGALQDLGALPVADSGSVPISAAGGINEAGWIVGYTSALPFPPNKTSRSETAASRAALWLPTAGRPSDRRLIDLNDCLAPGTGWSLESARAINNQGEIVGVGRIDGKRHAFLLRLAVR